MIYQSFHQSINQSQQVDVVCSWTVQNEYTLDPHNPKSGVSKFSITEKRKKKSFIWCYIEGIKSLQQHPLCLNTSQQRQVEKTMNKFRQESYKHSLLKKNDPILKSRGIEIKVLHIIRMMLKLILGNFSW